MHDREMNVPNSADREAVPAQPRLGFHEIVPGAPTANGGSGADPDIPQFDLNQHSMTELRKQVAARRKGPGQKLPVPWPEAMPPEVSLPDRAYGLAPLLSIEPDPIITQLVQRDIRKLCLGEPAFS